MLLNISDCKKIYIPFDENDLTYNNTVELVFNAGMNNLSYMLSDLENITEVDLSQFNSSLVVLTLIQFL